MSNDTELFTPLYNREAEEALLGGILTTRSQAALDAAFTQLGSADIFIELNRRVFEKCQQIFNSGGEIDVVSIADSLKRDKCEADVYRMVSKSPISLLPTITLIKDLSIRRQVQEAGKEMCVIANNHSLPIMQVVADASQQAFEISTDRTTTDLRSAADEVDLAMTEMERRMASSSPTIGIESGYRSYNMLMGGFHETNLTILAARPAMGKTAMALNFAARQAVGHGIPVLIFSMEMSTQQLMFRLFAQLARIDNERLKLGKLSEEEYNRLKIISEKIKNAPIYITDKSQTLSSICVHTRRSIRKHGIKQVYVDYLQKVMPGRKAQSREREVTEIAEGLKDLAKSSGVNITALCQLNRGLEDREDKRPILSDLRESGGIEQEADEVLALYRPSVYDQDSDPRESELIVRKHRNGALGTIPLFFTGEWFRFDELDMNHVNTPESFNKK